MLLTLISTNNNSLAKNFSREHVEDMGQKYFWRIDYVPTENGLMSLFIKKDGNDLAKFIHLYNRSKYTKDSLNLEVISHRLIPCGFDKDGEIVEKKTNQHA